MAFSKSITAQEYHEQIDGQVEHVILDTRSPLLYQREHLPNTINIRLQDLRQHIRQVPQGKVVVVVCSAGYRSQQAADVLVQAGFKRVYYVVDDYEEFAGQKA